MDDARRPLQFETAEAASSGATSPSRCAACEAPLEATYYEIDGEATCRRCHDRRASGAVGGSAPGRLLGALALGSVAGAIGAGIWYGIRAATGYEVGLVSIAIGLLVGGAVRIGSRGRGGFVYQALAVLVTYTAICSTYLPDLIAGFEEASEAAQAGETATSADQTASGLAPWADGEDEATAEHASTDESEATPALDPTAEMPTELDLGATLGSVALAGLLLMLVAYTVPFLLLPENLIGLLIIAFGLFEAWRLNRRVAPTIRGPFRLGTGAAAS